MSVAGYELFRERFTAYAESFVLIGGSACDLLFSENGMNFRRTKDLDIVLLADSSLPPEFAQEFWAFVKEGGYRCGWRNDDRMRFYRFSEPTSAGFPYMIELFAPHPPFELKNEDTVIAPLPVEDDVSSLSAILLNDSYYSYLKDGIINVAGINVLDAAHLIPLKAKAHMDLSTKKQQGMHVNDKDLKKHRKDVLALAVGLLPANLKCNLPSEIKLDMNAFIESIRSNPLRVDQLGLGMDIGKILEHLEAVYGLG